MNKIFYNPDLTLNASKHCVIDYLYRFYFDRVETSFFRCLSDKILKIKGKRELQMFVNKIHSLL